MLESRYLLTVPHRLGHGTLTAATAPLHGPGIALLAEKLATPDDYAYVARFRSAARQWQSMAVRVLLRATLETATRIAGRAWRIQIADDGRTTAASDDELSLPVSVSHSRNRVACALSTDNPIGVDIEQCRSDRDVQAIAEYAFADQEITAVRNGSPSDFYRTWTMREAVAKASGAGLAAIFERRIFLSLTGAGQWEGALDGQRFLIDHRYLPDGYSLSLAVEAT